MANSLLWGIIAASSLILGGMLTFWFRIGSKILGLIMAFGSGVLISAVAYELAAEAYNLAGGTGWAGVGLFAGALTFFLGDTLIDRIGGRKRKAIHGVHTTEMAVPVVLGIILDGIPESIVIGLTLVEGGTIGVAVLIAVFLSNLPEAIAATSGLLAGGWHRWHIIGLWVIVTAVCGLSSMAGYGLFKTAPVESIAFIQTFAGGAILVMLADTMMPEAFEHGGKLAGLVTVVGFALAAFISSFST
jgi:ZIP family zinc transporter